MNDLHPPGPTTSGDTVRQVAVAAAATTTADAEAPPIYARTDDGSDEGGRDQEQENELEHEPQIVILPSTDAVRFQHGFLGADGERAAIEGEVQIKGADRGVWSRVTVGLCTTERAYGHAIELGATELTLFDNSRAASDPAPVPASLPFSIPLTADTPQCVHTPQSSLTHVLTATLHRAGSDTGPALSKSVTVHTRRFAAHAAAQPIAPVRRSIHAPARIEVEVPRTTFAASEPIPVYVTVPSPRRELVVDEGLRLRNIKAELVRFVRVRESFGPEDTVSSVDVDIPDDLEDAGGLNGGGASGTDAGPSNTKLAGPSASSSAYARAPLRTAASGTLYSSVVSRSGALCRFHTSLPVRLRFVLHQSSPAPSPSTSPGSLPSDGSAGVSGAGSGGVLGGDAECAGISQNTLLHAVGFRLRILATFRHTSTHTERVCTLALPITLLPPPAPLPEVSADVDRAYQKKHDKPPARTVRGEETDADAAPHYDFAEGRAGPSFVAGAPPPFDDRDAPPPFSADGDSAPSSSRLPTFLESESAQHIYVPPADAGVPAHDATSHYDIVGEGVYFGFPASAQFSGHADDVGGGIGIGLGDATPPPTLEQATLDANVTELAQLDLGAPERAMHVLGLVLDEAPPPLPPPLDDPADPPPSIDQEYRSREGVAHQIQSPPALPPSLPPPSSAPPPSPMPIPPPPAEGMTSPAHAPPPYLVPEGERGHEHEHVSRPPPYVDYMPPETS